MVRCRSSAGSSLRIRLFSSVREEADVKAHSRHGRTLRPGLSPRWSSGTGPSPGTLHFPVCLHFRQAVRKAPSLLTRCLVLGKGQGRARDQLQALACCFLEVSFLSVTACRSRAPPLLRRNPQPASEIADFLSQRHQS